MQRMNISWSAKQVSKMMGNGLLKFDNIIQRSYVWEQKRKSDLIHSMIEGYPIPPFYARKVDGKVYDFLDGKQRMNAIVGFINNEYWLDGIHDVTYINENGNEVTEDINGFSFKDLPEVLQDAIKDYSLTIYYYENITDEQVRELFRKLNNGKPLSAKEKNIANMIDITNISNIGDHELFKDILTEKSIDARKQLPIVMKMWAILNQNINTVSFESKSFNNLVSETETTKEQREEIVKCLDFYKVVFNNVREKGEKATLKKVTNETNLVSLMPFVKEAITKDISAELFADWLIDSFTKDKTVSYNYSNVCQSGAAKNNSITKRNEELEISWNNFFKDEDE